MSKLSKSRHDFKSSVASVSFRRRSRLRSLCVEGLEERVVLSQITWNNRNSGSTFTTANWNDPNNWTGLKVPGAGDDAVINVTGTVVINTPGTSLSVNSITTNATTNLEIDGGSLTVAAATSVGGLKITGGTLVDNAAFTVNGATTWNGGTISGTGSVEAKAGLTLGFSTGNTASTINLSGGASLINDATANIAANGAGVTFNVADGSSITNKSTGTFNFQSSSSIVNNGGSPAGGTFVNQGTLETSGTNVSTTIGIPITNTNAIQAAAGSLVIGAGGSFSSASNFSAASGAKIGFTSGTFSIPSGATFSGAGGLLVNGATITYGGGFSATGLVEIDSGGIDFNTATTLGSLLVAGGTLGGSAAVVVNGQTTWTSGTLTGAGSTEAKAGLALGYSSGTSLAQLALAGGRSLINDAAASGAASGYGFSLSVSGGSKITNKSGSTFTFTSNSSIVNLGVGSLGGTFINQGTLGTNGGAGTTSIGIPITNTGAINALTGTLNIAGGGTFSSASQLSASSGAQIGFTSGIIAIPSGATFTGAGGLLDNGATITIAGAYSATGTVEIDSGEIDFNTATTIGSLLLTGGTLGGTGALVVNGQTNWSGGTITGAASIEAKGGLTLGSNTGTTTSQLSLTGGRSLINDGTGSTGSNGKGYSLAGDNTETITNAAGASFAIDSSSTISNFNSFANAGTVTIGSGSSLALTNGYTQSAGTTTLNGGLTAGTAVAINGGSLIGTGTITGNVTNAGQILPAGSGAAGVLSITGNYTQSAAGSLKIEIGGTTSGTEFDVLAVTGTATLAGSLNVTSLNSYIPAAFTTFRPLTSSSTTGDFATYTVSGFGTAELFKNYDSTGLFLHTVLPPTVPHATPTIDSNGTSSFNLTASDLQTPDASLVFTITSLPSGTLYAGGTAVTLGETFTGSPLALTYLAPSVIFGNFTDAFTFSVADSLGGVTSSSADLSMATPSAGVATVVGTPGNDTILVAASGGNLEVTINGVAKNTGIPLSSITQLNVYGASGDDSLEDSGLAINSTLNGGPGTNTLIVAGDSASDTFDVNSSTSVGFNGATITGASPLTLLGGAGTDTFNILASNIGATINGGTGNDIIVFAPNASLTTALVGGSGVNTIDESAVTTPVSLNVATSTVSGLSQPFSNIQNVIGGTSAGNTVTGPTAASIYHITGANAGNVGGIAFSGFGNLVGGFHADDFVFSDGATLTGSLTGGGSATIDFSAYHSAVNVNLDAKTVAGIIGGTFSGSPTLVGSATVVSTLNSPSDGYFDITAADSGYVDNVYFSHFGTLVTAAGSSNFLFSDGATLSGSLTGGGGGTLDLSRYSTGVSVNLGAATITGVAGTFQGISTIVGGLGNTTLNTVTGPAASSAYTVTTYDIFGVGGNTLRGFGNIVGGSGGNSFVFNNGAVLSGNLTGGGSDTIDLSAFSSTVSANLGTRAITGVGGTFSGVTTIIGTGGGSALTGPSTGSIFSITSSTSGIVGGISYSGFNNLTGGAGNDTFVLGTGVVFPGILDGGGGSNTIDVSVYASVVTLNIPAGTITGVSGTLANITHFVGGANAGNVVTGPVAGSTYHITGANAGDVGGIGFSGFGNVVAGAGNNRFVFSDAASLSGSLNAGAGTNAIDESAYTTPVSLNIVASTLTGVGTTFSGVRTFIGSATAGGTLAGPAASTYNITGLNAGNVAGVTFGNYSNLIAGTGGNLFKFSAAGSLAGGITGGSGTNKIDESAYTTPVSLNLATKTLTGLGSPYSNIQWITAGSGSNTLTGPNTGSTFSITTTDGGNTSGFTFVKFGNLVGGSGNDTFRFTANGSLTGGINGGGGIDTINQTAITAPITLNLATSTINRLGGTFSNISTILGGPSTANQVVGPDTPTTFNVTAYNAGNAAGVSYWSFRNIVGGAGNDVFKISNGVTLSGTINGGGGTNTIDDTAFTTVTTINLVTNHITGVNGYSSIQMVIGGSNSGNAIFGPNTTTIFKITSADTGNLAGIGFSGFGNLNGGSVNNTYVFSNGATLSGRLNGGTGSNTVNLSAYTTPTSFNLATMRFTGVAGPFSSIQSFIGGSHGLNKVLGSTSTNVFNITGANAGNLAGISFSRFRNLAGGTGNNTYVFSNGASLTGGIYGGGGTNTVNLSAYTTPTSVDLAASRFTGLGGSFSSIQSFIGSSNGSNLVSGPAAATTFNITALNKFNVNGVNFTGFQNITGGAAENSYILSNGAGLSGALNGGVGGTNWLDYKAYTTDVTVNLATGAGTGFGGGISNIYNVRGSTSGTDNLTGNSLGGILIGGGGTNTITGGTGASLLIAGTGVATINGGSGGDLIIGGSTTYDSNFAALDTILAEWQSSDTYATKISDIKNGGGLNGTNTLNLGTTVVDNLAANVLTGADGGKNWYFKGAGTTITNHQSGEDIN